MKLKSAVYRVAIRPAISYGSELWLLIMEDKRRLATTETRIIRWIHWVSLKDHIPSDELSNISGIANICDKVQGNRLRYYGHVKGRDEDHSVKKEWKRVVEGKRPRGRPKANFTDVIKKDMTQLKITEDDTQDRFIWRQRTYYPDPAPGGKNVFKR